MNRAPTRAVVCPEILQRPARKRKGEFGGDFAYKLNIFLSFGPGLSTDVTNTACTGAAHRGRWLGLDSDDFGAHDR